MAGGETRQPHARREHTCRFHDFRRASQVSTARALCRGRRALVEDIDMRIDPLLALRNE
jgi:hypothetical protein